jgi:hypothetical protein
VSKTKQSTKGGKQKEEELWAKKEIMGNAIEAK